MAMPISLANGYTAQTTGRRRLSTLASDGQATRIDCGGVGGWMGTLITEPSWKGVSGGMWWAPAKKQLAANHSRTSHKRQDAKLDVSDDDSAAGSEFHTSGVDSWRASHGCST